MNPYLFTKNRSKIFNLSLSIIYIKLFYCLLFKYTLNLSCSQWNIFQTIWGFVFVHVKFCLFIFVFVSKLNLKFNNFDTYFLNLYLTLVMQHRIMKSSITFKSIVFDSVISVPNFEWTSPFWIITKRLALLICTIFATIKVILPCL